MRPFTEIFVLAVKQKGGIAALEESLATTALHTLAEIAAISDDRILDGRFLGAVGKCAFIVTPDVVAVIREGAIQRPPGGKRDMATIQ
jgi:hypothetical protein